ncbi:MAG: hypothetical protein RBT49_01470 [Bacteroidales bacterium]|jgi:hypothetical protein|nr:hypothetical protein [Bacteroidales bacterium]
MKKQEMKSLLEKYFNGETSTEEEKKILAYFSGNDIDPELNAEKVYFNFLENEKKQLLAQEDISEKIWETIEKSDKKPTINLNQFTKFSKVILAIAAGIVITIVSVTLIKFEYSSKKDNQLFSDTYKDPEIAYQEAKKAMLFISEKLNKGTDPMQSLKSFNEGTENLGLIDNMDKGLIELRPVKSIEKVDKYIKK